MEIETEQPTDVSIDMNGIENGNDKSAPKTTIVRKKVVTHEYQGVDGLPQNVVGRGLHF